MSYKRNIIKSLLIYSYSFLGIQRYHNLIYHIVLVELYYNTVYILRYFTFMQQSFDIDKNECEEDPSPCQHTCKNLAAGFQCSCNQGYSLASDSKSCIGESFVSYLWGQWEDFE